MDALLPYILPVKGLRNGLHQYSFVVDGDFFKAFPDSPVTEANVALSVELEKRATIMDLHFTFNGTVQAPCDRCLAPIQVPVEGDEEIVVKLLEEAPKESEDEDVVFLAPETAKWSIAQLVYEFILLAMPLVNVYDCEKDDPSPCDKDMLAKLSSTNEPENMPNPAWDALKGLTNLD